MREKIAELIALNPSLCRWTRWDNLPQVYKDEVFYPLADQIHKEYMAWFLSKLKPLSDEESYALWLKYEKEHPLQDISWEFVAQAQLDAVKKELEGK